MREIAGNLWKYYFPGSVVCITTNGFVKKNGLAVMGRGCALEAARRIPALPSLLGKHIELHGNVPTWLVPDRLVSFPVKHNWYEEADPA